MEEWIANAAAVFLANCYMYKARGLGSKTIIQHAVLATIDDLASMIDEDKIIVCDEGEV
jgi:hypothetical protein